MKKALFLALCLGLLAICPVFAGLSNSFQTGADTTGWGMTWETWPSYIDCGPFTQAIVSIGTVGNCIEFFASNTTGSASGVYLSKGSPSFTAGTDTVLSCYMMTTTSPEPWNWVQIYAKKDGWGWTDSGANARPFWQKLTINGAGWATVEEVGVKDNLNAAVAAQLLIDEFYFGSGVLPVKDWSLY